MARYTNKSSKKTRRVSTWLTEEEFTMLDYLRQFLGATSRAEVLRRSLYAYDQAQRSD